MYGKATVILKTYAKNSHEWGQVSRSIEMIRDEFGKEVADDLRYKEEIEVPENLLDPIVAKNFKITLTLVIN